MSELIKTDVGEFFVKQTKNFENNPPDSMWESIESHIPEYSVSTANNSLLKYLISGVVLSVIIIAAILFYPHKNQNKTEQLLTSQNNVKTTIVLQPVENKTNKEALAINLITEQKSINSTSKQNTNKIVENNSQTNTNSDNVLTVEPEKTIKYSINATTYKNLNEIIFENEKNENVIDLINPVPNAFGFYEINISKLSGGTYKIWVVSNGIKTLHKTEIFK